jgi:hypothetical protein
MASVHADDFGGTITMTVKDRGVLYPSLATASALQIVVRFPDGSKETLDASLVTPGGADSKIIATMTESILANGAGPYDAQAIVTHGTTSKFHSDWVSFRAKPNL